KNVCVLFLVTTPKCPPSSFPKRSDFSPLQFHHHPSLPSPPPTPSPPPLSSSPASLPLSSSPATPPLSYAVITITATTTKSDEPGVDTWIHMVAVAPSREWYYVGKDHKGVRPRQYVTNVRNLKRQHILNAAWAEKKRWIKVVRKFEMKFLAWIAKHCMEVVIQIESETGLLRGSVGRIK
ncbi:hypothetical protein C5167_018307, partial [Papaver somniferum]